jgi:ATP-binding cassette, subfamily B, bacterial
VTADDRLPTAASLPRSALTAAVLIGRTAPLRTALYGITTAVGALVPVAMAWLTKLVLDGLTGQVGTGRIMLLAVGVAVCGVLMVVAPALGGYLSNEVGRRAARQSLAELFTATDRWVGLGPFERPALLDRLQLAQESSRTIGRLATDLATLGAGALTLVGFVGALLTISPTVMLIVLLAAAPSLYAELSLSRRRAAMVGQVTPHHRREFFYSQLLTAVPAAKEIRLFGLGRFFRTRMIAERAAANRAEQLMDRRDLLTHSALGLLSSAVAGAGLVWAVLAAHSGRLTPGDVSVFVTGMAGVQSSLGALVQGTASVQQRLLVFGHYVEVVRSVPDLPVSRTPMALPPLRTGVELRDVWFRYSDEHPWVLRGVSLTVPHGAAVALVGLNGAGKSTLVKLLCRMYDPTRGSILWDGVDIREADPVQLRERISAVFQDHMCYDLSAAENIAVGDLNALEAHQRITGAARLAGIHERVAALPRGYDTLLTRTFSSETDKQNAETGVVLSGGQWQRVALARAFLREGRDLMILDEPSSGLDPQAEHDVHERMLAYRANRTSLLVSHRFNAIREADTIAVLNGGSITEHGDHDTLMALDGDYARLFRLQASGYQQAR